jgi:SAM-dependent methyltransferase
MRFMADDPLALRTTFDSVAELYDRARPEYPDELFDELMRLTGARARDRVLEVGCATGKATRALAARGLRVTCVELGPALAAVARRNLAAFPHVEIVQAAFETWRPVAGGTFDLVAAATSWQWIDPELRYRRAWELLRPGGHLAFWTATHVFPEGGDPIFCELQPVYEEMGEGLPPNASWPRPGELPDQTDEIEASTLFDVVAVRQFDWQVTYTAEGYVNLLDTFSGHITMADWQRERLYGEIRRLLAERPDGVLHRGWGAALHVARRRDVDG